jgi:hypothetical protein
MKKIFAPAKAVNIFDSHAVTEKPLSQDCRVASRRVSQCDRRSEARPYAMASDGADIEDAVDIYVALNGRR